MFGGELAPFATPPPPPLFLGGSREHGGGTGAGSQLASPGLMGLGLGGSRCVVIAGGGG